MLKNKTVLVIGAGASAEAKLPVGWELKERIASLVNIQVANGQVVGADPAYWSAIVLETQRLKADLNLYLRAGYRIRDAMPQAISIDNFIDMQAGDKLVELCGKLAIARLILRAERGSNLHIDPSNVYNRIHFKDVESTWFTSFVRLLTENARISDIPERLAKIALIVFNYDRCVEHFIYHSLQNLYPISAPDAAKLVNGMSIRHPYGTVGKLPWEERPGEAIEYGGEPHPQQLLRLAAQLRTFTEEMDVNSDAVSAMRSSMSEAGMVVFLGFSFNAENLELLLPKGAARQGASTTVFATGKGQSRSGCELMREDLTWRLGGPTHLDFETTCGELFREYWKHLSLR